MTWLEGRRLLDYTSRPLEERNQIARAMFRAWWYPFSQYGVIHGDPHLGNYTVFEDGEGRAAGINLLDYGCMRTFAPKFVQGVVDLYHGLLRSDRALIVHAYETWGFGGLSNELIDILNIWANFIYGPMLEDRVRTIADQVSPGMYGRREAFKVHQGLQEKGPVKVPREFVFMDRAAIGLGGVFLHLNAELNYHRLFDDTIAGADLADVAERQREAFSEAGVPLPEGSVNSREGIGDRLAAPIPLPLWERALPPRSTGSSPERMSGRVRGRPISTRSRFPKPASSKRSMVRRLSFSDRQRARAPHNGESAKSVSAIQRRHAVSIAATRFKTSGRFDVVIGPRMEGMARRKAQILWLTRSLRGPRRAPLGAPYALMSEAMRSDSAFRRPRFRRKCPAHLRPVGVRPRSAVREAIASV